MPEEQGKPRHGATVTEHAIHLVSEQAADSLLLGACLSRARPDRYALTSHSSLERPLETLREAEPDALILSEGPQTEYLLRLLHKHALSFPVVLLLDNAPREALPAGVSDYLLRGDLQDALVHRVLDYSIQLRQARRAVEDLATRDSLTGALNRVAFRAHLERALDRSTRYRFHTGLLTINVDQFANINDHFGEPQGDQLIRILCERIAGKLRSTDSIARLGGDEFAVVLEDIGGGEETRAMAERILQAVSGPVSLDGQQLDVDVSIGAALFPEDAGGPGDLLENARSAMRQAKAVAGSRLIRYCDRLSFNPEGANSLVAELRSAARNNQFELHYQPRIHLESGRLSGLEALLRWNHPQRGLICPGEFIAACEDMGLMRTIGYQVIQHACHALNWLAEEGLGDITVAVNISFSQIQDDRFVGAVHDILERTGADARKLEFELTESTILKSPEAIKSRMDQLRALGIIFSLDDFGTGFSQLSHLIALPIAALKVDASFVRELPHSRQQAAICSLIIEMARRLDMTVIAEGAECHEQVSFLREQGCDEVQGFYFSQAIPLQQLPRFVMEQRYKQRERVVS